MKWIDISPNIESMEYVQKFLDVFLEDIRLVFRERKMALKEGFIMTLIQKSNKFMGIAKNLAVKKGAKEVPFVRIKLAVLKNSKPQIKLTYIPLDADKNPLLENKNNPIIIFPSVQSQN